MFSHRPTFQVYARYTCKSSYSSAHLSPVQCSLFLLHALLYFSVYIAALGALSCLVLMFFINAAYAGVTMGMPYCNIML